MFVHEVSVKDVSNLFSNVSASLLKQALLRINAQAVLRMAGRTFDNVTIKKDVTTYVGVRALIVEIIRSTIRICRTKNVNMGNRALVFRTMRDVYSSSRSQDKDVMDIKHSVSVLVDPFNLTVNPASQSALRLAVIYYTIYRLLGKMKV